jgi:hypothetical protein
MGLGGSKSKDKAGERSPPVPTKKICVIQRHFKCEPLAGVLQKLVEESRKFEYVEEDCAVRELGDLSKYEWVVYVTFSASARWMDSMDVADREALKEFDGAFFHSHKANFISFYTKEAYMEKMVRIFFLLFFSLHSERRKTVDCCSPGDDEG